MPDRYEFTDRELWGIARSMLIIARTKNCRHCVRKNPHILRHNEEVARRAIRTVRIGIPNSYIPASKLKRVYESAHAGYQCSCKLGRDEKTARRSAVVAAETELEFATGILEHLSADDMEEADFHDFHTTSDDGQDDSDDESDD